MTLVPMFVEAAAFEAHMAAGDQIAKAQQVERADPVDVALALAHAYGEAFSAALVAGARPDQVGAMNDVCRLASDSAYARLTHEVSA